MPVPSNRKKARKRILRKHGITPRQIRFRVNPDDHRNDQLPTRVYEASKDTEYVREPITTVRISLPIEIQFRGEPPKDVDPEELGRVVAQYLGECEDGRELVGIEALKMSFLGSGLIGKAVRQIVMKALGKRYKPRMIKTGRGSQTNSHWMVAEKRADNFEAHMTCRPPDPNKIEVETT